MTRTTGRCVVFDLDDTLFPERDYVRSGFDAVANEVERRYGYDCRAILDSRFESHQLSGAFQAVVAAASLSPEALSSMRAVYRAHWPSLHLNPEVLAGLRGLKRQDGVVACITDGRSVGQRNKIAALGLEEILQPVLISEETGYCKPDPHNYLDMMRLVQAREYWYVADNVEKDFVAPNRLGWRTIGVESCHGVRAGLVGSVPTDHQPQQVMTLPELFKL